MPFSMRRLELVISVFWPRRTTLRPRFSSCFLIHVMPCSCGSIISGQRAQLLTIAPFSVETRSVGRLLPVPAGALRVGGEDLERVGALDIGTPPLETASVALQVRHEGPSISCARNAC